LSPANIAQLLDQLDQAKHNFGSRERKLIPTILKSLQSRRFADAESLIRYHEILLFLRAYPHNAHILRLVETELAAIAARVERLQATDADLTPLEHPEVSGIAGLEVSDTFSYFIVRWLVKRYPSRVSFNWDWFEDENRLAETWPRFMPLLEEDGFVEANVPYRAWLKSARGRHREVEWLLRRFDALPLIENEKAELYDSQKLYVTWSPTFRASRTGMRLPVRKIFYQSRPLMQRRDVAFAEELKKPAPSTKRLSRKQGDRILDMARETSTIRYRELYGFTHGDPNKVLRADMGKGVELLLISLPPGKRLPLRAYHAAMIFKNGIPVGYFEGLSLFERMESGFNLYYSFRDGETAWLYAQTLNLFRQQLGVTVFTLDPYQIGHENDEGIESGAFWFYRKLGFRSTDPELREMTQREEEKIQNRPSYRTPARVLRKLATKSMIFELDGPGGDWDRFQVRNLGLQVQKRMARQFGGEAERLREASIRRVAEVLSIRKRDCETGSTGLAVLMAQIPEIAKWSKEERGLAARIIQAKADRDESQYLKLMQRHGRLRQNVITLGSS
jgi:hypothetical protein